MNEIPTIADLFPPHLFWDLDVHSLNVVEDKSIIIPRALYFTNKSTFPVDIARLEQLYTPSEIVHELRHTHTLISNEVRKLVAERFNVTDIINVRRAI